MLGAMLNRLGPILAATLAAGAAGALAIACGGSAPKPAKLHPAGSPQDDGSGLLARASVKFMTGDDGGFDPEPTQQPIGYDYGYAGFTYGGFGGDYYGYGGSPYASYQPTVSYNQPSRVPSYSISYATDNGVIEGQVSWPKPPKVPATVEGPAGCDKIDNSLPLGSGNTVEGAIVYLEKISAGKSWNMVPKPISVGGTVETRDCALTPRAHVFGPVPGPLTLANGDATPRTLYLAKLDDGTSRTEYKLEAGGARSIGIDRDGVLQIGDVTGRLPAAYVVTASHPYYTLTDARGEYRFDDVVPGDYTVIAWFPPVVTGVVDGVLQYSAPTITRKKVTVKKLASARADLSL